MGHKSTSTVAPTDGPSDCASTSTSSDGPPASSADEGPQASPPEAPPPPPRPQVSLLQPSQKKRTKSVKMYRLFRSVFRTFPIISPGCRLPTVLPGGPSHHSDAHLVGGTRVTGTLFGYRKGRVSLAIQEAPKCLPHVVIELALQTNSLLKDMSSGLVRIALECDKRPDRTKLLDEPLWTMYCNGKRGGYGVRREPNEEDLNVMQLLQAVSMGAGVLPSVNANNNSAGLSEADAQDGELAYMRAYFERVVGSRDSEAFYMLNPDGSNGPELSIFMVRI
ncbi:protein MIZU-KUSSEI 1 [Nymphaea colorata]|uniref:Protein MIZU-KUSSEI 1 n=1 Tax=Nymphaea colorata TaxID=210225 RepID=A0A5K1AS35_9MAGN|nr:protein MIZU-KUSSEI 1 [Nymphaea colorata]